MQKPRPFLLPYSRSFREQSFSAGGLRRLWRLLGNPSQQALAPHSEKQICLYCYITAAGHSFSLPP